MRQRRKKTEDKVVIPIAPMIDCVFLLLVYFMVSSSLKPQEADIGFQLPGVVEQDEPLDMPDEQIIEITAEGQVVVNEYAYDTPGSPRLVELAAMLHRFKQGSDANKIEARVTIAPDDAVAHRLLVRVMDACAKAGIENVNFSMGEEAF